MIRVSVIDLKLMSVFYWPTFSKLFYQPIVLIITLSIFSAVTEWLESELSDKNSHISHLISRYENSKLLSDLSLLCQNQEADDIAEVFQNILDQCSKTKQKTILNILNSVE